MSSIEDKRAELVAKILENKVHLPDSDKYTRLADYLKAILPMWVLDDLAAIIEQK